MKKTITYKEIKDKVLDIINNGGGGGGASLKSFTFEGNDENGLLSNIVDIPTDCNIILGVFGVGVLQEYNITVSANNIYLNKATIQSCMTIYNGNNYIEGSIINSLYSVENGKITFEQIENGNPFNYPITYTVYYM